MLKNVMERKRGRKGRGRDEISKLQSAMTQISRKQNANYSALWRCFLDYQGKTMTIIQSQQHQHTTGRIRASVLVRNRITYQTPTSYYGRNGNNCLNSSQAKSFSDGLETNLKKSMVYRFVLF